MSQTNAQAALQAASTVYSGGRGHTTPASVKLLAETFKNWLDAHDKQGQATEAEPQHRGRHFVSEDHNGDPICHCGWDPARELVAVPFTREDARNDIREHIAGTKSC